MTTLVSFANAIAILVLAFSLLTKKFRVFAFVIAIIAAAIAMVNVVHALQTAPF
jgi:hypothetical protein